MNSYVNGRDICVIRGEVWLRTTGLPEHRAAAVGRLAQLGGEGQGGGSGGAPPGVGAGRVGDGRVFPDTLHWAVPADNVLRLQLLVADEDASVRSACAEIARRMGFAVIQATDGASARAIVRQQKIDMMLMDLPLPGGAGAGIAGWAGAGAGLSLLEDVKELAPHISVVVMTATATVSTAVEAMRLGAEDLLIKPFALGELQAILKRSSRQTILKVESRLLRERLRSQSSVGPLIGNSPEMEKLYRIVSKVAHSTHPVLIAGESGTGKELVARSIHFNGPQSAKPFVAVDCGSMAPSQLEGELFGYVRGAGALDALSTNQAAKEGLLAAAAGGTVLLDEIGELPLDLQSKLQHALEEKAVRPVGANHTVPISVRLLAATNADLLAMVDQGRFRRDLYFRLKVVSLRIPPLRQRREDIPELIQFFLQKAQPASHPVREISDEALRALVAYEWPGNVRELENEIARACELSSGPVLMSVDFSREVQQVSERLRHLSESPEPEATVIGGQAVSSIRPIAELERDAILDSIRKLKGDKLLAAKLLGIGKTTLYRKLKEYGVREWGEAG